jgi:hypothetical protein
MIDKGYLYVAYGKKYLDECITSVSSLKAVNPNSKVALVTDNPGVYSEIFDEVITLEIDKERPYINKIKGMYSSPFVKTIFVDTDTYFCHAVDEIFGILDYFDMALSICNSDYFTVYNKTGEAISGMNPYNTGVMAYRKNEVTKAILLEWEAAYLRHFNLYVQDQAAFMEALLYSNVRTYTLPTIYNARTPYPCQFIAKPVKIIHGRHNNYEKIAKKLNRNHHSARIWYPRFQIVLAYRRTSFFNFYLQLSPNIRRIVKAVFMPLIKKLGMREYI